MNGFWDLWKPRSYDASFLADTILNFLHTSNLSNYNIIAQSQDGARVMSGCLVGVQAKIKIKHPTAVYTHCILNCQRNLVVIDMCNHIKVFNIYLTNFLLIQSFNNLCLF